MSSSDEQRMSLTGRPSLAPPPPPSIVSRIGASVLGLFEHLGQITAMTLGTLRLGFKRPLEGRAIMDQLESLGVASLGIVTVTSIFIGMVMAVQFAFGLRKFGGMEYTGRVVGLSFARELAPTLTAVIVGGRIGAGMAAEVGSMAVTEQIDAVRALGADPLKKLVWPRLRRVGHCHAESWQRSRSCSASAARWSLRTCNSTFRRRSSSEARSGPCR